MKNYPYIQEKKKIADFVCDTCKQESKEGYRLEWRVDIFQGNCEFENTCFSCFSKAQTLRAKEDREQQERDLIIADKEEKFWDGMKAKLEEKYQVKYLTNYQWRINGIVDIFPQSRRFHDIRKNVRGSYKDMFEFLTRLTP